MQSLLTWYSPFSGPAEQRGWQGGHPQRRLPCQDQRPRRLPHGARGGQEGDGQGGGQAQSRHREVRAACKLKQGCQRQKNAPYLVKKCPKWFFTNYIHASLRSWSIFRRLNGFAAIFLALKVKCKTKKTGPIFFLDRWYSKLRCHSYFFEDHWAAVVCKFTLKLV